MIEKLWKLFKETGDVRIFNLLGKVEGSKDNGNNKSRRDSNRRN